MKVIMSDDGKKVFIISQIYYIDFEDDDFEVANLKMILF